MSTEHTSQAGIAISTSITAGGDQQQHAEGTVPAMSTSARHPNAPRGRDTLLAAVKARQASGNDIVGIAASTAITAGGYMDNHVEGIVLSTSITGGGWVANHAEGLLS